MTKQVEMTEEDHAAFLDYIDKRDRKILVAEISAKIPRGTSGSANIKSWLETVPAEALKSINHLYNPIAAAPVTAIAPTIIGNIGDGW